jgi:uncharacterized protein
MGEIDVRVQPRASRNRLVFDGGLKAWVMAAPTDGQANTAVCVLVAKALGVAKMRVTVVRGETSRTKRLAVEGMSDEEIRSFFE